MNSSSAVLCNLSFIAGLITLNSNFRILRCNIFGDVDVSNASQLVIEQSSAVSSLEGYLRHDGKLRVRLPSPLTTLSIIPFLNHSKYISLDNMEIDVHNEPQEAIKIVRTGTYLSIAFTGCNLGKVLLERKCEYCKIGTYANETICEPCKKEHSEL
jgi:hypothetical protein